jgi:hypothetical protein
MALKCRGPASPLNFALDEYEELLPMLPNLSKVASNGSSQNALAALL